MDDQHAVLSDGGDAEAAAEAAGLHHVTDAEPGIRRRRRGRGFSYLDRRDTTVDAATRRRIESLAVPPAWSDVWICADPLGHLQATGRDARGRKQYRYHDRWREVRDADKFSRLTDFGDALPDLRDRVDADLSRSDGSREQVLALVVRLLDETLIRVGNEEYAVENESFGLTTLRSDHLELGGSSFVLRFVGKGGIEHDVTVRDRRLARLVRRCHELGGQQLFTYRAGDGSLATVTSGDVNDYLHRHVGPDISAKVFRTWGASSVVTRLLAEGAAEDAAQDQVILAAIDAAAAVLGNTRTVCRQSYVHPGIAEAYRSGELADIWARSRTSGRLSRPERTLTRVVAGVPG